MKATPKTKKDMQRLYTELHRVLKELEEVSPELRQVIIKDSNGLSMESITNLFIDRGDWYLRKVSETLKVLK